MYLNFKQIAFFVKTPVMKFIYFLSIVSLSVIGLSACGGGGSSENSSPTTTINSDNATQIVRVATSVAFEIDEIGETGDFFDFTSSLERSNPDAMVAASRIAMSRLDGATVKSIQIQDETSQCAFSGSVTISGSLAGTDTFTKGDVIRVDANMCDDGNDETVDGVLQMTITNLNGDITTSEFLLGINLVFTKFTVTESGEDTVLNGDFGMTLDTRTSSVIEMTVFGDNFTVSSMGKTQSLSNFSNLYIADFNESPIVWEHKGEGTVSSNEFEGNITYQMPVSFEGYGANYPYTGELLVTGANNATLRLITIDDVYIKIEADYNGDGIIDETLNTTWIELEE